MVMAKQIVQMFYFSNQNQHKQFSLRSKHWFRKLLVTIWRQAISLIYADFPTVLIGEAFLQF